MFFLARTSMRTRAATAAQWLDVAFSLFSVAYKLPKTLLDTSALV